VTAQGVDVLPTHGRRGPSNHFREFGQRFLSRGERGEIEIPLNLLSQIVPLCFLTEILPVSFDSIEATIGPGDDGRQQFAFGAAES
jgi:hypothetical protein